MLKRFWRKRQNAPPNALLRQKHLAELAGANQDIETAAQAWRQAVALGTYSIHDNAENHLSLAQSLSDLSEGNLDKEGVESAAEALSVLTNMENRFNNDETIGLKSRIVQCRIHAGQGRQQEAEQILTLVCSELDSLGELPADIGLDFAKTLFRMGREDQAKNILGDLASRFDKAPDILQKIESLLDEPVGFREKLKARSMNRKGIEAFEAGDLDAAVEAFNKALSIVPDHTAVNLNLVQVMLKQYDQNPEPALLATCAECLERLSKLPEQHRQYRRYLALTRKLKGLTA